MNTRHSRRSIRRGLAGLLSLTAVAIASPTTSAQSVQEPETRSAVELALERLPRYGVFESPGFRLETLPVSRADDRIRWMTFYQIYTDDDLARYAPGGSVGARFDAFQFGGFPGMQPAGYPIHIIVKGARTTLVGVVDNAADKQIAEVRAREVPGVFAVSNQLVVAR